MHLLALPVAGLTAALLPGRRVASGLVGRARSWPVDSQQAARRNAMLACTVMAELRVERQDVDDFLRALHPTPAAAHG